MTSQEAFTKAVVGLKSQGYERSLLPHQGCAYRDHKNKRKCAIGHLITDAEAFEIEGRGFIGTSYPVHKDKLQSLDGLELPFLRSLQSVHDWALTPKQMEEDLRNFAKEWKLEFPA